jgi:uncharacterized LabA/DUF88 family protein
LKRVSGHGIDHQHSSHLQPIQVRIRIYVDGYGAKLSAGKLYYLADKRLHEHLRSQPRRDDEAASDLYNEFHAPPSADVFAEITSFCLNLVELKAVSEIEQRYLAKGTPVFPNAMLVNRSNPLMVPANGKEENLLELLHPLTEAEYSAKHFISAQSDGIIFVPKKIERQREKAILTQELKKCAGSDQLRAAWIRKNLEAIDEGKFYYRDKKSGGVGPAVDFQFSEKYYEEVASRIGSYSRLGETKINWRYDLSGFGEKGVDCSLIMQAMDDLHLDNVDAFVFMTNDTDFLPLVSRIISEGKHVFICGREGSVSTKLIKTVGGNSYFDLLAEPIVTSLPTVFMAMQRPELRSMALQWVGLAMRREQGG